MTRHAARDSPPDGPGSRTRARRCARDPAGCHRTAIHASGAGSTAQVRRQRIGIDRKTVVLAGDEHLAGVEVLYRMVRTVMPELHLDRPRTRCERQQLVPETDPEGRNALLEEAANRADRIVAGLRVARPVGQEDAVRCHRQHLGSGRLRRHHGQLAAARGEHAQDVALDAEVVRDHVKP